MASKKRTTKPVAEALVDALTEKDTVIVEEKDILTEDEAKNLKPEEVVEIKAPIVEVKSKKKAPKIEEKTQKYPIGSIVYISKDAEADLNGFKLFPQYKKYTYTVEAYNDDTGVYSLRRLNLSLRLKEDLILAPSEKSGSSLIKSQF